MPQVPLKQSNSAVKAEDTASAQSFKIICPKCKTEIPLIETLAQPLIAAEREKVQEEVRARAVTITKREQEVAQRLQSLDRLEANLNARAKEIEGAVEERIRKEREALTRVAEKKASDTYAAKLRAAEQELAEKQARRPPRARTQSQERLAYPAILVDLSARQSACLAFDFGRRKSGVKDLDWTRRARLCGDVRIQRACSPAGDVVIPGPKTDRQIFDTVADPVFPIDCILRCQSCGNEIVLVQFTSDPPCGSLVVTSQNSFSG
jgi:hypothetical protein